MKLDMLSHYKGGDHRGYKNWSKGYNYKLGSKTPVMGQGRRKQSATPATFKKLNLKSKT